MTRLRARLDQHGCIVAAGTDVEDGVPLPDGVRLSQAKDLRYLHNGWIMRPSVPAPVVDGDSVRLTGLPSGTEVRVVDRSANAVLHEAEAAGDLSVSLHGAARVVVEIDPPRPWLLAQHFYGEDDDE